MTEIKVMRRDWYDSNDDGIVDTSQATTIFCEAGTGGINAFQVCMLFAGIIMPANGENTTHAGLVVGIAPETILEGASGKIQLNGEIENTYWSLVPGDIYYLGVAGTISDVPPAIGFWQKIGVAKDAITLILNISEPIKLII